MVIRTDQQSLKFMATQRLTEGIQHKLLMKLMEFDYSIEYKKGKENKAADALSRRDTDGDKCLAITLVYPAWVEDVKNSYMGDEKYAMLVTGEELNEGAEGFTLQSGLLRYKNRIYVGQSTDIRQRLLQSFHNSTFGGHSGMKVTYHKLKKIFYWPKMKKDVDRQMTECPTCQIAKPEHIHVPGLLDPLQIPEMAWTHISMDFIEGLPKSHGKDVILVVVDRLTKYAHFVAMSHPFDTQDVIQVFMENVYRLHGMPVAIVSDRDRIFTSELFQNVFKAMGTALRFSTSYHPQSDGQTERVNQCVEAYLRCMVFQEPKEWYKWLPTAEWWYNTSYHTSLQVTPYEAMYGVTPPQIGERAIPGNVSEEARATVQQREDMLARLKENLAKAQTRIKKFADRLRSERQFELGDMVYLKMQPYRQNAFGLRGSLKLRAKFYGPFRVLEKIGKVAYKLQLPEEANIHPVFHVSQLKKHVGR